MKIVRLQVENVKKIKLVDIMPGERHVIKFTGDNGQGKTSMLDSIWYALGGVDTLPPFPVREGNDMASIKLDLGDLIVERIIYRNRATELNVYNAHTGVREPRAQTALTALLSKIAFDPLAFVRLKPDAQADELRRTVNMDVDPAELEAQNAADYTERGKVNRRVDELATEIAGYRVPPHTTDEPIDLSALLDKLKAATEHNAQIEASKSDVRMHELLAEQGKATANEINAQIDDLLKRIESLKNARKLALAKVADEYAAAKAIEIGKPIDTLELDEELRNAEANNNQVALKRERAKLEAERDKLQLQSRELTEAREERKRVMEQALKDARFPVDGLTLMGKTVMYKGLPLSQASGAEQLRIGLAVAMAGKPKLRFLRIADATMLGPHAMQIVKDMAVENDFQVFMEVVDPEGKDQDGFVMVEGEVFREPAKAEKPVSRAAAHKHTSKGKADRHASK
jgi:predicted ATP-dependent endonuclease of OLD family